MKRNRPYTIDLVPIGLRLKKVRQSLGLNQDQLGAKVDLSKTTICDYEVGKTPPGFDFLYKLSGMFDIDIDFIMRGEGPVSRDKNRSLISPPGEKVFGEYEPEVAKILDYMKKSNMVLLAVVTMALDYIDSNKSLIEKSMNIEKEKRGEKKDAGEEPGNTLLKEVIDGKK